MNVCYNLASSGFIIANTQVNVGDIVLLKDKEKDKEDTYKLTKWSDDSFELTITHTNKEPVATLALFKYSEKDTLWKVKRTDHKVTFEKIKKDPRIIKLILNDNDVYYF